MWIHVIIVYVDKRNYCVWINVIIVYVDKRNYCACG